MIKLTDEISSILIDENSIIAIVPTSNHFGIRKTCVHLSGGSKLIVNETPEEILAMPDIETTEKVIDWEQRRFYLISALFVKYACSPDNLPYFLGDIIPRVDALINELKKGQDNED